MIKYKLLITLFLLTSIGTCFAMVNDTTIVEFSDNTVNKKVTVITQGENEFSFPVKFSLNSVLKELGIDTTERKRALVLVASSDNTNDTLLLVNQDGQKIQIVTRENLIKGSNNKIDQPVQEDDIPYEEQEPMEEDYGTQDPAPTSSEPRKFFSKRDFGLYLGLNNFANASPAAPNAMYDLRTWKSRFVALSLRKNATLIRGNRADLALCYGPESAWSNYMFENNVVARIDNGIVQFSENSYATKKTKLVSPQLNLPVLLAVGIKKEKFKLGVGGYVGYHFGGYTKVQSTRDGKEKTKGNFGFQDFQYGLTAEMGKKNGLNLFFRYDLKDLFDENQVNATGLRNFSFGIRL